jgi:hypothetical protein
MNCIEDLRKSVTNPRAFVEQTRGIARNSLKIRLRLALPSRKSKQDRSPYCRMVIFDEVFSEIEFFGTNGRVTGTV